MKVILKTDVDKLGAAGEVRTVTDGFARNYLIPRGLVLKATPAVTRWFEKGKERREKMREQSGQEVRDLASRLTGVTLSFTRPVGDNGKLFGSVGKSDVVKSLKASGFAIDKNSVALDSAIKEVGDFEVEIRLHADAVAKIKVSILARS